jgi:hypothetical protein
MNKQTEMLQTVLPFAAGFAASYAGRLGPHGLLFCAGLTAGFGAGYWFARNEIKNEKLNYVVDATTVGEETGPYIENKNIQPYDSDNTDEFFTVLDDLKTGDILGQVATTNNIPTEVICWASLHQITK